MDAKYRDTAKALRVHDFESVDDCAFIFRHLIPWTHFKYTFFDLVRPISVTHGRTMFSGVMPSTVMSSVLHKVQWGRSFDVFFDLYLNKRLSKQSRRRWLETPWHSFYVTFMFISIYRTNFHKHSWTRRLYMKIYMQPLMLFDIACIDVLGS